MPVVVTVVIGFVYLAIITSLIVVHENVPPAPPDPAVYLGLNLSEAWQDLRILSRYYHPFNSRKNDDVRNWLLHRIDDILTENGVDYTTEDGLNANEGLGTGIASRAQDTDSNAESKQTRSPAVTVFNDLVSNYTTTLPARSYEKGRRRGTTTYFEGNNIIVYIRGTEDEDGEWWKANHYHRPKIHGKGGVMVNSHFDSVSTGFGATDDGVGVVTELQLIKYFTSEGQTPKNGIVALLNNGEEDGLYGGKAFFEHPMASFVHTFVNLEGAGAGGRAILFRSTDTEVTKAYSKADHPLGSVISNDAYRYGFIRSETDYSIFKPYGYRGLDIAFYQPRAKYHTYEDDTKDTSRDSVWDMLSATFETVKVLTSDTSNTFIGSPKDGSHSKIQSGRGTDAVWFDVFGSVMAVFSLKTLFAWSLTLLVASPLVLIAVSYILIRYDKYYLFSNSIKVEADGAGDIHIGGWRGFSRFPIVIITSSALTIGAAFLIRKCNPLIIYSSPYTVWAMSSSLFIVSYWFMKAGCNFVRPSALHRQYALLWMFTFGWAILVGATVLEDRFKLSGGYLIVFYEAAVFLAALIGLLEMFALPTKSSVMDMTKEDDEAREGIDAVPSSEALIAPDADEHDEEEEPEEPTETTSLLGENGPRSSTATFNRYRQSLSQPTAGEDHDDDKHQAFGNEQKWSARLPSWTWILQFLLLGPFMMILVGDVGLKLVTATNQTSIDGSNFLTPYLIVAIFTILFIVPVTPFAHRITYHAPSFLFMILIGTLIYNLSAFPFSLNNRFKAYFQQTIDLDTGINQVTLAGLEKYVLKMIHAMPSAAGQDIKCESRSQVRAGLSHCFWQGIAPEVVDEVRDGVPPEQYYDGWLHYTAMRDFAENKATFHILGKETRACVLRFDDPVSRVYVHGAADNNGQWADVPESGSDQIKLWSRDWNKTWEVDVEWHASNGKQPGEEGRSGRVVCLWSDHNGPGIIPALDEVMGFSPVWSTVTKLSDGLVEGSKAFNV